jgi:hypothetical protein
MLRLRNSALMAIAPLVFALGPLGCIADIGDDDGDVGDEEPTAEVQEELTTACAISRAKIQSSVSGERKTVVDRAFTWWDAQVPYSQSKYYRGYRTDCSGFISMAWQLGTSYTTANFVSGGGESFLLGSYNSLQPGDALVRRSNGAGHIVMFLGWNNSAKTSACVIEQTSTALDMEFGTRTVSSLRNYGYKPIRADKFQ